MREKSGEFDVFLFPSRRRVSVLSRSRGEGRDAETEAEKGFFTRSREFETRLGGTTGRQMEQRRSTSGA